MTSAIAIQPAPDVSPSTHCGVIASEKHAPPTPANAPPITVCAYRYAITLMPIASAAAGDSPTARRLRPGRVRPRYRATSATQTHEAYTSQVWSNSTGPTTRACCHDVGNTGENDWRAGASASLRSLPRYDERPAAPAKIVSASPETIWFARSVTTRKAWINASAAPARAATTTASPRDPVRWTPQNPITAPTSIIPSTPRFRTPERSA